MKHALPPLLACMIASISVFGAEVNLPDATDLEWHGVKQGQFKGFDVIMLKAIEEGTRAAWQRANGVALANITLKILRSRTNWQGRKSYSPISLWLANR